MCCACGTWRMARSVRSRCVMTRSTSGGRLLMALLVTEMLVRPASCTFLRSTPAPIALEPIPASQATMILRTWLRSLETSPAASGVAPLDSAFMSCIRRVAASISSSSFTLLVFSRIEETTNETAIAAQMAAMFAKYAPFGVIASTARIEPGEAGDTRPPPSTLRVNTPVIPPRITARIRRGFISTYGK